MSKATSVTWAANEFGYVVQTCDESGEVLDEYNAGNSKFESSTYVDPKSPGAETEDNLRQFAERTALLKAAELGLTPDDVSEDSDAVELLREIYGAHGPEENDDGEEVAEANESAAS